MQENLGEVLDNILGLLLLEGSYDIHEDEENLLVDITTPDAGRLIGFRGESLDGLQLLINQMMAKKANEGEFKRVVVDVSGWRKKKQSDLEERAKELVNQVLETGHEVELEPMPSWQRRVVHMIVSEIEGVESESMGERENRHLIVRPAVQKIKKPAKKKEESVKKEE